MPRAPAAPENPFRYGDVATADFFTDRDAELDELVGDIRSGQNVLVLSPRRYGKTSLVIEAVRLLPEQDVLVAYVDLLRATSKAELAGFLAPSYSDARSRGRWSASPLRVRSVGGSGPSVVLGRCTDTTSNLDRRWGPSPPGIVATLGSEPVRAAPVEFIEAATTGE